jgi:ATP-dependent Clp protease ATP-binding subunit ClpC
LGLTIEFTDAAKDFLSEKGYDPAIMAPDLCISAIQKYMEDPLAEEILRAVAKPGDTFVVDLNAELQELVISFKSPKKKAESELNCNR